MIVACQKIEDKSIGRTSSPTVDSPLILHRPQRGAPRAVTRAVNGAGVARQTGESHDLLGPPRCPLVSVKVAVPSGQHTKNDGKSPCFMDKL